MTRSRIRPANLLALTVLNVGAALGVAALSPSVAHAQVVSRFALHTELAGGSMLASYQQSQGFRALAEGRLGVSFALAGPLALQVGGASRWFPRDAQDAGQIYTVGGGLRLEPRLNGWLRVVLDANANLGFSGAKQRFAWDLSAGAQWQVHPAVGVGVFARFGHILSASTDFPSDAYWLTGGLSLSLRVPAPPRDDEDDRDSDGDGVIDREDFCPVESIGEGSTADPLRPGCPAPSTDRDHDGVVDREDFCPETAAGPQPDLSRRGCPASSDTLDSDGDGISDAQDACPREAGVRGRNPRRNGCPRTFRFSVEGSEDWVTDPIFFERGEAEVSARSTATLPNVLEALQLMPMIRRVSVQGHADETGTPEHNIALSRTRAQNVYQWLVSHGIAPERLTVEALGTEHPMIDERSARAYAVNRRVEFHILEVDERSPVLTTRSVTHVPANPRPRRRPR
ncbi:MAG: OmpA family protein [Deltaproteobacteria bacterium]|nr:OmpA family protein [Deltaproteobacteria bacterium]